MQIFKSPPDLTGKWWTTIEIQGYTPELDDPSHEPASSEEDAASYDSELVGRSLGKVGKGAGVLFVGTVLGIFFNFLARLVIARYFSPEEYGIFNLFLTFLTIFVGIGMLGLTNGISRFIGYYMGSGENKKIKTVEGWGLLLGVISGILFGSILFLLAPEIAPIFSAESEFENYLKIAAVTIPFYVIFRSILSVFRGHQRTKENILFYSFGRNTLFLIMCLVVGVFAYPFAGVIWSMFLATVMMTLVSFAYYFLKHPSISVRSGRFTFDTSVGKRMLIFSLPLVLVDLMYQVMGWADTLMIGIFLNPDSVGFYNVAKPLSVFISAGLSITIFIYTPLVAGLYAQKKFRENRIIFSVLTKWVCFMTLPFSMILFLYSREVVNVFGSAYHPAIVPLQILVIAYFINNLMGPNGATLTAYGKTKFLMYATCFAAALNIVLNIIFIPRFGIVGAAAATALSVVSMNVIKGLKLYSMSGVHSMSANNLKPVFSTVISGTLLVMGLKLTPLPGLVQAVIALVAITLLFLVMLVLTKSLSDEDRDLIKMLEAKTGIKLLFFKKMLDRYT